MKQCWIKFGNSVYDKDRRVIMDSVILHEMAHNHSA